MPGDSCREPRLTEGRVGATFDGEIIGLGNPALQSGQAMKNIKVLLEEAGSRLEHVVKMTIYVTDWVHREPIYRVIGEWMRGIRYCSTGITVADLARPEWVVEIDAYAVIPGDEAPSDA